MASTTRAKASNFQVTGILDMRHNEVTNLETDLAVYPLEDDQGATKIYVDTTAADLVANLPTLVDNGDF